MSELINSNVVGINGERNLFTVSEVLRTSLSGTRCDNEILHDVGMIGLGTSHEECNSSGVSGVAREIPPIESSRDGTSLSVINDIVGEKPKHSGQGPHNARELVRYFHWAKCSSYVTLH